MLTEQDAFEAMRFFLTEFWKRGGSRSDSDLVDTPSRLNARTGTSR